MCIIAIKCKGVDMPDEQTLKTMWTNNPHGAGIMYARDGRVCIDKGYMDWTSFYERIKSLGDTKDMAVVMHFRIATHGAVIPGNTHPFPVTNNVAFLTKLRLYCRLGVAHNGIIPITPREGISDTMEYIATELAPLSSKNPEWYKDKSTLETIGKRIQSKLAVLDGEGTISYYGDFITESDGMVYSNNSYKPRLSAVYTYRDNSRYDWLEGDDCYDFHDKMCPPWDTGRKSVWLMSVPDLWSVGGVVNKATGEAVEDAEDLWADSVGNVYAIDYDTSVAYMLPSLELSGLSPRARRKSSKFRVFKSTEGFRFEFGGQLPYYPF